METSDAASAGPVRVDPTSETVPVRHDFSGSMREHIYLSVSSR
eukprot:SAG25_NODE_5382_length_665_cov_1.030035_1_plen_42_part_01